jgi:hypothetical protein
MQERIIQLVELSNVDGWVSGSKGTLVVPGEPVFGVYRPVESAEVITIGERRMIRFGRTGVFGSFLKMMMRRKTRETLEWLERLKAI